MSERPDISTGCANDPEFCQCPEHAVGERPDIDRHPATEPTATLYRLTDELPAKYRAEAIQAVRELVALARDGWQTLEHPFDQSEYDAMFKRAEVAEARVAELEAALRTASGLIWARNTGNAHAVIDAALAGDGSGA